MNRYQNTINFDQEQHQYAIKLSNEKDSLMERLCGFIPKSFSEKQKILFYDRFIGRKLNHGTMYDEEIKENAEFLIKFIKSK